MLTPPGYNVKYFSPLHPSENFVRRVTASSSVYSSTIAFNVPDHHKAIVKQCLNEIGVLTKEWDTENHGTWFDVTGVGNVKKSLDGLRAKHLIDDNFYQTLIESFPKAHSGTLNLTSITQGFSQIDKVGIQCKQVQQRISEVKNLIFFKSDINLMLLKINLTCTLILLKIFNQQTL